MTHEPNQAATEAPENTGDPDARGGRCAILGRPNVGKSTLLNALLGQKLAITTPRPGTTRSCILGVYASKDPATQIAFVDTPGIGRSKTALHRVLVDEARGGLTDADVVVVMTDVGKRGVENRDDAAVYETAQSTGCPIVVAINKVDRLEKKDLLLPALEGWQGREDVSAVVPMSATRGTNLQGLVSEIRSHLPKGLLYPEDFLTDRPERFFVAELVREAVIGHTRDEVPYGAAVQIEQYEEEERLVRIHATLIVEKQSHKKIVIGSQGSMLKTIGTEARQEIEKLVGRKVFLKLWVKVVPGWTSDPRQVRQLATGGS